MSFKNYFKYFKKFFSSENTNYIFLEKIQYPIFIEFISNLTKCSYNTLKTFSYKHATNFQH